ncbi:uncharacterized protein EAE97_005265 [Botrytis byssoidea]|uniref:Uncharacterized protein n=1 Tax=Botrytis byssoidea TaxID=139641 RepID=A0A9P5IK51_9HELO|nr:uncharacterized protein EAE97_005265 [Botrytis byssoidea]KAF7944632.1 hypothetical protein EAE97_005265 [Botrytis byssoidea]
MTTHAWNTQRNVPPPVGTYTKNRKPINRIVLKPVSEMSSPRLLAKLLRPLSVILKKAGR